MYVHLLRAPFLTYHPIPFFPLLPVQLLFIFIFNIWNHFLLEVFPASLAQSKFGLGMCLVIPSTLYLFYFSTQLAALPTCLSVFTVLPIKKVPFCSPLNPSACQAHKYILWMRDWILSDSCPADCESYTYTLFTWNAQQKLDVIQLFHTFWLSVLCETEMILGSTNSQKAKGEGSSRGWGV